MTSNTSGNRDASQTAAAIEQRLRALRAAGVDADELHVVGTGYEAFRLHGADALEQTGAQYAAAMAHAEQLRFLLRETALAAHETGMSAVHIAKLCAVSRNTINSWIAQARDDTARLRDLS